MKEREREIEHFSRFVVCVAVKWQAPMTDCQKSVLRASSAGISMVVLFEFHRSLAHTLEVAIGGVSSRAFVWLRNRSERDELKAKRGGRGNKRCIKAITAIAGALATRETKESLFFDNKRNKKKGQWGIKGGISVKSPANPRRTNLSLARRDRPPPCQH